MNRMLVLCLSVLLLPQGLHAQPKADPKTPTLEGKWEVIGAPRRELYTFTKDKLTIQIGNRKIDYPIKTDTAKTPFTIDVGDDPGLYKIESNKLFLCYNPKGQARPKEIKKGAAAGYWELKRVK